MMTTHTLAQGTPEWLAYRAQHFNASDAPAMMGCSPYKTRAQLLREMHTGLAADVDAGTQRVFDAGHRFEALARPLAEAIVGEDLYPVVGSRGKLSASFDGLTLCEGVVFEHKTASAALRDVMTSEGCAPLLPLHYRVQMEQQLMVSGAWRALFMATLWDGKACTFSRHCWYEPDEELRAAILNGWSQFERDLAAYTLPASSPAAPVGKAPDTLPALHVEVTGMVTASNLGAFKGTALAAIRGVNRTLSTDADFADADKAVKWCAEVEQRLSAAKQHALSQTASIDALFRTMDDIAAEARAVRLELAKLVDRRKVEVKEEAVVKARKALDAHVATLNAEIAPMRLPPLTADFAGAIKSKRTMDSVNDALDSTLVAAMMAADIQARGIRANLVSFKERAAGLEFLFADLGQLTHKEADDFGAVVSQRIAAHRVAEEARESARKKLEADALAARAALQAESARLEAVAIPNRERLVREAQVEAAVVATPVYVEPAIDRIAREQMNASAAAHAAQRQAPTKAEPATLTLGEICGRLGFVVTAAFITDALHVKAAGQSQRKTPLYSESQFTLICAQLQAHVSAMAELYEGVAA